MDSRFQPPGRSAEISYDSQLGEELATTGLLSDSASTAYPSRPNTAGSSMACLARTMSQASSSTYAFDQSAALQGRAASSSFQAQAGDASPAATVASSVAATPTARGAGAKVERLWYWLNGDQRLPVHRDQWVRYDDAVSFHLGESAKAMLADGRDHGKVLDLEMFTTPPQPYQVWKGSPLKVTNAAEEHLYGKMVFAGYPVDLWTDLAPGALPLEAKHGRVVAGYYQLRSDHVNVLADLEDWLTNPDGHLYPRPLNARRRVIILVEIDRPDFVYKDPNRFRKKKRVEALPQASLGEFSMEHDAVPLGEAVFQWWWGDPNDGGKGHWKNYHPHVSKRLEMALTKDPDFAECRTAVPIDGVRYMLQRIKRDCPFSYLGKESREQFLPEHVVTIDHSLYDAPTRIMDNCFVQFQQGNPKRRRPVRRVRRGESAGLDFDSGQACPLCMTDSGTELTGCPFSCVLCPSCIRAGLRCVAGDATQKDRLVCGHLSSDLSECIMNLAVKADEQLQNMGHLTDPNEIREFEAEVDATVEAFQVRKPFPQSLYAQKISEWLTKLQNKELEHLYYACSHPNCGIENWILRSDFIDERVRNGGCTWTCGQGHRNSVLPSQEEICEINRNILLHPEYYTDSCGHDRMRLRRYRLCPECVQAGLLTFAVHDEGCKQWPGTASQHTHCFCFHCTRQWGGHDGGSGRCSHSQQCGDPGIQQVRRILSPSGEEKLEIGFVNPQDYIGWIVNGTPCPPTVFDSQPRQAGGAARQRELGLEDQDYLRRQMEEGTR